MLLTAAGLSCVTFCPFPISPRTPYPQHETAPLERRAHVWFAPAAICVAPLASATTGTSESVPLPSPSWPLDPAPQQTTAPPAPSAHVCDAPCASCCGMPAS